MTRYRCGHQHRHGMPARALTVTDWLKIAMAAALPLFAALPALAADAPSPTVVARPAGQTIPGTDLKAIEQVIRNQLSAFAEADARRAFALASRTSQRHFGTPERFLAMVHDDYQPLLHPRMLRFEEARPNPYKDGDVIQKVSMLDDSGLFIAAYFSMTRQQGRQWRVSGCMLGASEDRAL